MSNLQLFQFDSQQVRVIDKGGEPWFVAKDVCAIFDQPNTSQVLARLRECEKGIHNLDTLGGKQETAVISEPGLYRIIMTSRKPQAEAFQDWVVTEVLPAIRKTGSYSIGEQPSPILPSKSPDERVVDFTNALRTLASYGIDLVSSPRYQTLIRDFVADKILGATHALPGTESERWLGVAEKAEEMGYNAYLVGKCRSQLGRYVKSSADALGLDCKQEHRFCHGTNRPIWIYRDCVELSKIVSEFMGAKTLSTHIEDDGLIG